MILNDRERADQVHKFFESLDGERCRALVRSIYMILDRESWNGDHFEAISLLFKHAGIPFDPLEMRDDYALD